MPRVWDIVWTIAGFILLVLGIIQLVISILPGGDALTGVYGVASVALALTLLHIHYDHNIKLGDDL